MDTTDILESSGRRGLRGAVLSDSVFAALKRRILRFELDPGQALTEQEVAVQMGVSRTPIREALRRLEHEQLVRIIPRKGAIVIGISEENIREAHLIRQGLEGICARRTARLISQDNLEALGESLASASHHLRIGNRELALEQSEELHRVILAVGGTPRIRRIVGSIRELVERLHEIALSVQGRLELYIEERQRVYDTMRRRDGPEAEYRIREHIANTEAHLLAAYRNRAAGGAESLRQKAAGSGRG